MHVYSINASNYQAPLAVPPAHMMLYNKIIVFLHANIKPDRLRKIICHERC